MNDGINQDTDKGVTVSTEYSYDEGGRLIAADDGRSTWRYGFDETGNRERTQVTRSPRGER